MQVWQSVWATPHCIYPFNSDNGKGLIQTARLYYDLAMRTKNKLDGRDRPSFIEVAWRVQIIECTIETLATLGYKQAWLAQIAKRAGISKGVITYYFTIKEQLIEQIVSEIYMAAGDAVRPSNPEGVNQKKLNTWQSGAVCLREERVAQSLRRERE